MTEVFWLLLPAVAVLFAFLISVLADFRREHKFDFQQFSNHAVRLAMYLSAIGVLEVVKVTQPDFAGLVAKLATAFAFAEIAAALGQIKSALGPNDPLSKVMQQTPFDASAQNTQQPQPQQPSNQTKK